MPEKHPTSELIRRQKAGLPLEDGEQAPLIKREKGNWKGIEGYDFFKESDRNTPRTSAGINTAKTTLAHERSSHFSLVFRDV